MTLRQTIQAAPGKTTELIAKLSATSNQAVKTREGLFAQLSEELARYVEIEEQHFLPLLRKHPQTKDLAVEATKGNKDLRASLEKLSALPKNNDEFLAELAEMNKGFQQHVRNERKELLPAVLDALSDDEATALAANIQGAVAEAEKAKREEAAQAKHQAEEAEKAEKAAAEAEKAAQAKRQAEEAQHAAEEAEKAKRAEQRKEVAQAKRLAEEVERAAAAERAAARAQKRQEAAQAKRQAEEVEAAAKEAAAAERAALRAQKAAERSAREASEKVAETVERGAASMQDNARQMGETITERAQQVAMQSREAMTVYGGFAKNVVEDLQAVRASSAMSMGALTEVRAAWMEWFGKAARLNVEVSQQLVRCKSVTQVAEIQRAFATTAMRNWMERSTKVLGIAQHTSKEALRPLDKRLNEAA